MSPLRVALTFDAEHPDRPTESGATGRLLEVLAAAGVQATFFIQGRWAEADPATARAIADEGHRIGNHSHYHARMSLLTDAGLVDDLAEAGRVIAEVTGADPRPWFRWPFGDGAGDARVERAVAASGYTSVGWHVDLQDWSPDNDAATIERDILAGVERHGDGTVLLLHGWPRHTPAAVAAAIPRLLDRGATFVTLDALDDVPALPTEA